MFTSEHAFFIKKTEENRFFTEFLKEGNCFFLLEIRNTLTKDENQVREELKLLLKEIKEEITAKNTASLYDFEDILDKKIEKIEKVEETDAFSLTAGLLVDSILYLAARGNGKIYLKRDDVFKTIISSGDSASGMCQNNDFFIFTSDRFFSFFDQEKINKQLFGKTPKEMVNELVSQANNEEYVELSALLLLFKNMETAVDQKPLLREIDKKTESDQVEKAVNESVAIPDQSKTVIKENISENELLRKKFIPKGKWFTLLIVIILFLILLWSVVFSYKRRVQASLLKKVKIYKEKIESSLAEVSNSSFLDYDKSFNFLSLAKKDLDELKKIVGKTKVKEVKELEQKIFLSEKQLIKKEERKYEEFYDLNLIEKEAQASKMFFNEDSIALLNANDGEIYVLSLIKKSTESYKKDEIRGAALTALYNKEVFFFKKSAGIYKFDKKGKFELAIADDKDWGEIIDLWVYNGNIYLLDRGKDEIYKYLVAENGYSAKTSYFKKGYARKLNDVRSMAIDLSVYFATGDNLYKYTSGIPTDFKIKLPVEKDSYNFDKVFTNNNCHKLYILDKDKGKIFIFNKSGEYEKQIDSSIFSKADDFITLEGENGGIYVLVKDKIYKVGIE